MSSTIWAMVYGAGGDDDGATPRLSKVTTGKAGLGQPRGHAEIPGQRRLPAAADEDDRVAFAPHLVVERDVGELEGGHPAGRLQVHRQLGHDLGP